MGVICEVAVANGKATFVTQGHMSSVAFTLKIEYNLLGNCDYSYQRA
jgi:hypothetical protein